MTSKKWRHHLRTATNQQEGWERHQQLKLSIMIWIVIPTLIVLMIWMILDRSEYFRKQESDWGECIVIHSSQFRLSLAEQSASAERRQVLKKEKLFTVRTFCFWLSFCNSSALLSIHFFWSWEVCYGIFIRCQYNFLKTSTQAKGLWWLASSVACKNCFFTHLS